MKDWKFKVVWKLEGVEWERKRDQIVPAGFPLPCRPFGLVSAQNYWALFATSTISMRNFCFGSDWIFRHGPHLGGGDACLNRHSKTPTSKHPVGHMAKSSWPKVQEGTKAYLLVKFCPRPSRNDPPPQAGSACLARANSACFGWMSELLWPGCGSRLSGCSQMISLWRGLLVTHLAFRISFLSSPCQVWVVFCCWRRRGVTCVDFGYFCEFLWAIFWVHPSSFASTQAKSHAWRHMKLVAVGVCVNWFNVDIHPLQKISPQFLCILTVQGNNNISEAIFLFKVHKGYERWRFSAFSNLELSFCLFWTQNRKQSNLKCGHLAPPAKFNSSTIQQQFNNCNTTAPFLKWPILQDPPRKHHHFEEYTNHTRSPGECFPPFFWFW